MSGFVVNVGSEATRGDPFEAKTVVKRIAPEFFSVVPVWHWPQVGSFSQPVRLAAPTVLIDPWQSWHCISIVPSGARAFPIAPRRRLVSEPGWQR